MTYDHHMKTLRPNKCNRCLSVSNVSKDERRNTEIFFQEAKEEKSKNRKVTRQLTRLALQHTPNLGLTQQVETLNRRKDHGFCSTTTKKKTDHGHTDFTSRPSGFVNRESFQVQFMYGSYMGALLHACSVIPHSTRNEMQEYNLR